jgi:hypothetical protein
VSEISADDPQLADAVRLTIDNRDGLHLVWTEVHPPEYLGRHVLYARSTDGGMTWTPPQDLSDLFSANDWETNIDIATNSLDQIVVVWVCEQAGRCYRVSEDGGDSWSDIQPLFWGLVGLGAWDAVVADPYGNVYWVGILRPPAAFYFSRFSDKTWIDPPIPIIDAQVSKGLAVAHYPQITVGLGNQLHAVMVEGDGGSVWYMNGHSSWPGLPPASIPSPSPLPTLLPTSEPTLAIGPAPAWPTATPPVPPMPQTPSRAGSSHVSEFEAIAWPTVSVVLFLVTTIAISRARARH